MGISKNIEIKTGKLFINNIEDYWFRIPEYQRHYVWTTENIKDLLDDLEMAFLDDPNSEYFLGSIVYQDIKAKNEKDFNEKDLLDGQQRITSLILLLAVIRDRIKDDQLVEECHSFIYQKEKKASKKPERLRIVYRIREETQKFLNEYIKEIGGTKKIQEILDEAEKVPDISIKNIANAIKVMNDYFQEKSNLLKGQKYLNFLVQKVLIVFVSSEELDDAFRMFSVLNARGLKLNNSNLLKNVNLRELSTEDERIAYSRAWEEMEDYFGDELDRFIGYARTILLKEKARLNLVNEFEKKIYLKKNPLLEKGKETFDYVLGLKDDYSYLMDGNTKLNKNYEFDNLIKVMDHGLPSSDWIPSLLAFHKKYRINKLYDFLILLDNKFSSDWIIGLTPTQRLERMNELIKMIEKSKKPEEILNSPFFEIDTKKLLVLLSEDIYGKSYGLYILLKINFILSEKKDHTNIFDPAHISIEHILPRNPDKKNKNNLWFKSFDPIQMKDATNKVGNLILMGRRKNSSQGRKEYKEKRDNYLVGNIESFAYSNYFISKYTKDWTYTEFLENQKYCLDKIKKYYTV